MSIPKKGSRLIVVQGATYRWNVRRKPSYLQALAQAPWILAIEPVQQAGCTLVVRLSQAHPKNWMGLPSPSLTPRIVAAFVQQALSKGWQPHQAGKPFTLIDE